MYPTSSSNFLTITCLGACQLSDYMSLQGHTCTVGYMYTKVNVIPIVCHDWMTMPIKKCCGVIGELFTHLIPGLTDEIGYGLGSEGRVPKSKEESLTVFTMSWVQKGFICSKNIFYLVDPTKLAKDFSIDVFILKGKHTFSFLNRSIVFWTVRLFLLLYKCRFIQRYSNLWKF